MYPVSQELTGDLRKRTPKYGPSLTEVDWGGKNQANHTNGCMLSEVDWGVYDTHTSGCMLFEVDWELMKPMQVYSCSLKLIGELIIQVFPFPGAHCP